MREGLYVNKMLCPKCAKSHVLYPKRANRHHENGWPFCGDKQCFPIERFKWNPFKAEYERVEIKYG